MKIYLRKVAIESLYDNEKWVNVMERHRDLNKRYGEQEFEKKLEKAVKTEYKGYAMW